ncbi:hypothetical protein HII36_37120 [Nonomuraea sp. NN258]|nr:hypothetical protein [Nonomuraea antri]NRQ37416.1 hypothetical protein [Nonomuraea antri]
MLYRLGLPIQGGAHLQHPGRFAADRTPKVLLYSVDRVREPREIARVAFM